LILILLSITVQAQIKFPENLQHIDATKPLIDQVQIKGTHWSVADKTARNSISAYKREIGMLVTWVESSRYVTKRYEAVNTLDVNWTNDLKWFNLISENDTITYSDTAIYVKNLIEVDSINFNGTSKELHTNGNLIYDTISQSLQFHNDIVDFNHNLGYELVSRVYNQSGATILNGSVVRLVGSYKDNGKITLKIRLAGNGSSDSSVVLGMATIDIPNNSYGIVTLRGEVKGLNTSSCSSDSCNIYLGSAGNYIDTIPEPPNYSVNIGQVYYADNDSGRIFFSPNMQSFDPEPHISADTSRATIVLDLTQNVFKKIPISHTILEDSFGFIFIGDSIKCLVGGHVNILFNMSYIGNIQNDVWRKGIFINNIEKHTVSRSTASTAVGNSTVMVNAEIEKDDYISFKMTNQSADRDPTIKDISFIITFLHE